MLAEQLAISRELTQKVKQEDSSDNEDEEDEVAPPVLSSTDKENPWMNNVKSESEIDEFVKSYRQYWDEKNKKSEDAEVDRGSTSFLKENTMNNRLEEQKSKESSKSMH